MDRFEPVSNFILLIIPRDTCVVVLVFFIYIYFGVEFCAVSTLCLNSSN